MARDYVYGKRKTYINPIAYFMLGASIQLLSLWFSSGPIRAKLVTSLDPTTVPNYEQLEKIFDGDVAKGVGDVYLTAIAQSYTYAAVLFFTIPLALLLWGSQHLVRSKYCYGEVLVFAFYVVGHLLIMTALVMPIAIRVNDTLASVTGPAIYLGYILYAHGGFFKPGITPRILSFCSMLVSMLIFFASIGVIFLVSLVGYVILKAIAI